MTDDADASVEGLKPYPAYRDSGMPGLGPVPKHWEARRQRNALQMLVSNIDKHTVEDELPVRLCNYVDVYKNDRITENIPFMRASAKADEAERFRPHIGDVIITKDSESWDDIGVPALVEYTASDLVCGYHLAILRPREGVLHGAYLLRALQSLGVAVQYHISANGVTRYGLSHDAIKNVVIPLPSLPEQSAIARFLDHYDRLIRRYIRAKRKLIALLNEQKQGIIQHAVTRGLDPNVRLKPSEVEWLGDIPEHWECVTLRRMLRPYDGIKIGPFGSQLKLDGMSTSGFKVYGQANVIASDFGRGSKYVRQEKFEELSTCEVRPGDLLLTMMGTSGRCAMVPDSAEIGIMDSHLLRLRPVSGMNAWFAALVLDQASYVREQIAVIGKGSIMQGLNSGLVKNLVLALPPLSEQSAIFRKVRDVSGGLNKTIDSVHSEIEFLREYRARLIADVVTGKLDVREAAANLPEEQEETEELEEAEGVDGEFEDKEAEAEAATAEVLA